MCISKDLFKLEAMKYYLSVSEKFELSQEDIAQLSLDLVELMFLQKPIPNTEEDKSHLF